MKKMRIVILTSKNHFYAYYIIRRLIAEFKFIKIIESNVLLNKLSFAKALLKYLKVSGIKYILAQAIKKKFFDLFHKNKSDIPVYLFGQARNINDDRAISYIKNLNADLHISIFFNQILGKKFLKTIKNVINVHPSFLPSYRGISPVFWALANGEIETGVTVHRIDNNIDTGKILKRSKVKISDNDTEHTLYVKCCDAALNILPDIIKDMGNGGIKEENTNNLKDSYYSLPTKEAVKKFRNNGRKFYTLKSRNRKLCGFLETLK